jgi:EF-hand domain pair
VWNRVVTVVDFRNDGVIDWEEFLCYKFIADYAGREQQMRFVFNLFDLTGNGRVDRDELKRMTVALMSSPSAPHPSQVDVSREFAPLLDLFSFLSLYSYDRDADRQLSWPEWRSYAEDDDRVSRMVDEINSRRGRRRERKLRQQLMTSTAARQQQQLIKKTSQQPQQQQQQQRPHRESGEEEEGDESQDDGGEDDDSLSLSSPPLCWSEWCGGLDDDSELSAWEEYRNRMRTAAGRMTTPTMDGIIEGEQRIQQQQHQRQQQPNNTLSAASSAASSSSSLPPPHSSPAAPAAPSLPPGVRLGPGAPSSHPPPASTRSRIFNTVNSLRGKK